MIVDSSGGTPPQDMTGRTDAPMDEDGMTAGMELLSVQEEQGQSAPSTGAKRGSKVST